MDWAGGYVADIAYTANFHKETAPSHIAFATLCRARSPGRAFTPKKVMELGFGQGFGLALLAAANPDVDFQGCDFNPEHVSTARRLAEGAALTNLRVVEASFEDIARAGGDDDLDIVIAHGIFSWVSRQSQDAVVDIVEKRLRPEGIFYISYNCMPGWAPLAPIRQFMLEVKRRYPGSSERQLTVGLDMLVKLKKAKAKFFTRNPSARDHLDAMLEMDRVYLAHEYLDDHGDLFTFSEVFSRMSKAKLSFLASATLPDNFDNYALQTAVMPLVAQAGDIVMQEMLRDLAANRRFRRDVYGRGNAPLTAGERFNLLSKVMFSLALPREMVSFKFAGPLSELTGNDAYYAPVADRLAEGTASFEELLGLPAFGEGKRGVLLDCLALLIQSRQVLPAVGFVDPEPSQRFNRAIVNHARAGRFYGSLATPVGRTGVPVTDLDLLGLAALFDGQDSPTTAARHAMKTLKSVDRRPTKDGKIIEDDKLAMESLEAGMQQVLEDYVPVWRKLGVI